MITLYRAAYQNVPRARTLTGNSTEVKPDNVENGAIFKEIDTGKIYRFDKENKVWFEGRE